MNDAGNAIEVDYEETGEEMLGEKKKLILLSNKVKYNLYNLAMK